MATSADRFEFAITSGPGTSWEGTKEPIGYPILKRTWNRPDELTAILEDIDKDDNDVDLDEVRRGDIISLTIDGNNAFYGEILNKIWESTQGHHLIKIFAMDSGMAGAWIQMDRALYNGFVQLGEREVDDDLRSYLRSGITPLRVAEVLQPQGNYDAENYDISRVTYNQIYDNYTGTPQDTRSMVVIFTAQERDVNRIWLPLINPENDASSIGNDEPFQGFVRVTMYNTKYDTTDNLEIPDILSPVASGRNISGGLGESESWQETRVVFIMQVTSASPTVFTVGEEIQQPTPFTQGAGRGKIETLSGSHPFISCQVSSRWTGSAGVEGNRVFDAGDTDLTGVSSGVVATLLSTTEQTYQSGTITGSDLSWVVDDASVDINSAPGSAATGSSLITPAQHDSRTAGNIGRGRYVQLRHYSANSQIRMYTTVPNTILADRKSRSGWVSLVVRMLDDVTYDPGEFHIKINANDDGTHREIARCYFGDDSKLYLVHSENLSEELFTYSANTIYYIHFRVDFRNLRFDFFTQTVGGGITTHGFDFGSPNRTNFTTKPDKISSYEIYSGGSTTSQFDVGWINGSEIPHVGHLYDSEYGYRMCQVDYTDEFLDLTPGKKYALNIVDNSPTTTLEHIFLGMMTSTTSGSYGDNDVLLRFRETAVVSTYSVVDPVVGEEDRLPAFIVEYPGSWKSAESRVDYTVDSSSNEVQWLSTSSSIPIKNPVFINSNDSGLQSMKMIRVSEYINPDSNIDGLLVDKEHSGSYTSHKMTVWDIVKHINSIVRDKLPSTPLDIRWSDSPIISESRSTTTSDAIGVGFHDDTDNSVDVEIIKQRSLNDALRDIGNKYGGTFFLSAGSDRTLIFHGLKEIGSVSDPPGANEYILTDGSDPSIDDDDYIRIIENKIGRVYDNVFTTFPVKGESEEIQVVYINWDLISSLGREVIRKTEVFPKETNLDSLLKYAQLLNELYGVEKFEGDISVVDYWPTITFTIGSTSQTRLDTNSIIRIIDDRMETGDQVFKTMGCEYNGMENRTKIFVTNTNRNTRILEQQITETKQLLSGNDPTNPETHIHIHNSSNSSPPSSGNTNLDPYVRLYDDDDEIDTNFYNPPLANRQQVTIDGTTYSIFTAFFGLRNGTIKHDALPITAIKIESVKTGTGTVIVNVPYTSFNDPFPIYKWDDVTLQLTFWVEET